MAIDIFFLKNNGLLFLIPIVVIGLVHIICEKCRNWTFRINTLFVLSFFILMFDIATALSNQYENFGKEQKYNKMVG